MSAAIRAAIPPNFARKVRIVKKNFFLLSAIFPENSRESRQTTMINTKNRLTNTQNRLKIRDSEDFRGSNWFTIGKINKGRRRIRDSPPRFLRDSPAPPENRGISAQTAAILT